MVLSLHSLISINLKIISMRVSFVKLRNMWRKLRIFLPWINWKKGSKFRMRKGRLMRRDLWVLLEASFSIPNRNLRISRMIFTLRKIRECKVYHKLLMLLKGTEKEKLRAMQRISIYSAPLYNNKHNTTKHRNTANNR